MRAKKPNRKYVWGIIVACFFLIIAVAGILHLFYPVQSIPNITTENITTNVVATKMTFEAKVLEVQDHALIVKPLEGTQERGFAESISIDTEDLAELISVEYVAKAQANDQSAESGICGAPALFYRSPANFPSGG